MQISNMIRKIGEYLSNKGPAVAVTGLYAGIYMAYFDTL